MDNKRVDHKSSGLVHAQNESHEGLIIKVLKDDFFSISRKLASKHTITNIKIRRFQEESSSQFQESI
jgi:hypothetical protein